MKRLNRKFKAFTLVELIVVMAIFSIIMFGAISLMRPVSNQYKSTAEYESARASLDTIRRYIEGNLRYADKVHIYNGFKEFSNCKPDETAFVYETERYVDVDGSTKVRRKFEADGVTPIKDYFADPIDYFNYMYYDRKGKEDICVMGFHNDDGGRISLDVYKSSGSGYSRDVGESKNYAVNEAFYNEYAFNIHTGMLQSDGTYGKIDIDNFTVTLDLFKKNSNGSLENLNQKTTASFSMMNVSLPDIAVGGSQVDPSVGDGELVDKGGGEMARYATRLRSFNGSASIDNFYIIYTVPKILGN